ncbi:MAG: hypothetical protein M3R24_26000 [Chloroflexota bacterium]|nr:hypothetical protein [Chloroflexota bacterium]PLS79906.1 MAG: hypothetical protein CYG59_10810 [Chloroflexota bacterium]
MIPAGLWLGSTPLLVWANRLKPDLLAVMFSLLALLVLSRSPQRVGWAAMCFGLAWYSKQAALAGPAAVMLWLLIDDPRRAFRFGSIMALAIGVPFLALDLLTQHGFYIHMIDFHALPWSAARWLRLLGDVAGYHAALVLFSLMAGALALYNRIPDRSSRSMYPWPGSEPSRVDRSAGFTTIHWSFLRRSVWARAYYYSTSASRAAFSRVCS